MRALPLSLSSTVITSLLILLLSDSLHNIHSAGRGFPGCWGSARLLWKQHTQTWRKSERDT